MRTVNYIHNSVRYCLGIIFFPIHSNPRIIIPILRMRLQCREITFHSLRQADPGLPLEPNFWPSRFQIEFDITHVGNWVILFNYTTRYPVWIRIHPIKDEWLKETHWVGGKRLRSLASNLKLLHYNLFLLNKVFCNHKKLRFLQNIVT